MITNLSKDILQDIAIYNDSPRFFVYFELDKTISEQYNISIAHLDTDRVLEGFSINKQYNNYNDISVELKYTVGGEKNKRYASFCIEQDIDKLDRYIKDDIYFSFIVENVNLSEVEEYKVHVIRNFNLGGIVMESNKKISNEYTSHMVLRTNPKLSGNIKLVISPEYDLFLDTFPVTPTLAKKDVRKKELSAISSYSKDVYTYFSKIPHSDIFNLNDYDTYDISLPKKSLDYQYSTTYNYGARMLNEELYSERFSILAPLWIQNDLPDFFVVFKVDGAFNKETYEDSLPTEELMSRFINNGKIIKSWSLKESTPLGKYLNKHLRELNTIDGNVFISLDSDINNSWSGIPIKHGIMSELSETTYEFDNIANNNSDNFSHTKSFTELNNYITDGFSRNGVICPNLLNLQFNFDDNEAQDFEMCRYFGLYVSSNELLRFNYYNGNIINLNQDIKILDDIEESGLLVSESDVLFGITEGDNLRRVTSVDDIRNGHTDNIITSNKVSTLSKKVDNCKFISLTFKDGIGSGEHYIVSLYRDGVINTYEAISVGVNVLQKGEVYNYTYNTEGNRRIVHFCVSDEDTNIDSCRTLADAFNELFNDVDDIQCYGMSDKLSIVVYDENITNVRMDYITSEMLVDMDMFMTPSTSLNLQDFEDASCINNIKFFGYYELNRQDSIITNFNEQILYQIYGPRLKYSIKFIQLSNILNAYTLDDELIIDITPKNVYKYNGSYYRFENISKYLDVYNTNPFDGLLIEHPLNTKKCVLSKTKIDNIMNSISIYTLCDAKFNVFSICKVKDFDFTVYFDNEIFQTPYAYNRGDDKDLSKVILNTNENINIVEPGCYKIFQGSGFIKPSFSSSVYHFNVIDDNYFIFNTFIGSIEVFADSKVEICKSNINEFDVDSYDYDGFDTTKHLNEEDIESYIESKQRLRYGLTTPYVCKWSLQGSDCRSNNLLLRTNNALFKGDGIYSNFIPISNSEINLFNDEISYPTFKVLDTSKRGSNSYVSYDINDRFFIPSKDVVKSLKELYLDENTSVDVFSKIMYSNTYNSYDTKKTSILKYNKFYNTLSTIFKGIKLNLNLSNKIIDINKLDGFSFSMVLSSSKNSTSNKPFDVFINMDYKNVLIVWYANNSNINYTSRHNTFVDYKNFLDNTYENNIFLNYYKIPIEGDTNIPFGAYNYTISDFILNTNMNVYEVIRSNNYGLYSTPFNKDEGFLYQDSKNILSGIEKYTYIYNGLYDSKYMGKGNFFEVDNNYNSPTGSLAGVNTYGEYISNKTFFFKSAYNNTKDSVGTLNQFTKLINNYNNYSVYVINDGSIFNSNTSNLNNLLKLSIEQPKLYNNIYTHAGWYSPVFKNIIQFDSNNTIYGELFNIDLLTSNIKIKKVCNIEQLWYYKVKDEIVESDVSKGLSIDYRIDFNPMMSRWDKGYYIKHITNEDGEYTKTYVNGYMNPIEESSMFGSKLVNLPHSLELNEWSTNTSNVSNYTPSFSEETTDTDKLKLEFNISNAIREVYSNENFTSNWNGLQDVYTDNYIGEYINETILPLYDKYMDNIIVNIFVSDFDGSHIAFKKPGYCTKSDKNYNTNLTKEFDNYIYNIIVPKNNLVTYFVEILIK